MMARGTTQWVPSQILRQTRRSTSMELSSQRQLGQMLTFALGFTGASGGDGGTYFNGSIDEVSVWNRVLTAAEVLQIYRRGANRTNYQIRACTSSSCADNPTWLGPDGTATTYFSERYNTTSNLANANSTVLTTVPNMAFGNFNSLTIPSNSYFQYRLIMESDDRQQLCNYGYRPHHLLPRNHQRLRRLPHHGADHRLKYAHQSAQCHQCCRPRTAPVAAPRASPSRCHSMRPTGTTTTARLGWRQTIPAPKATLWRS